MGDFTVNMEQFAPLLQCIHRPGFRFMTVTDLHDTGYILIAENQSKTSIYVPRMTKSGPSIFKWVVFLIVAVGVVVDSAHGATAWIDVVLEARIPFQRFFCAASDALSSGDC